MISLILLHDIDIMISENQEILIFKNLKTWYTSKRRNNTNNEI